MRRIDGSYLHRETLGSALGGNGSRLSADMNLVRVAAAVLNQTPLDWEGNLTRVRGALAEARRRGATVLCLPELCLTGYGCEDTFPAANTLAQALRILGLALPDTAGMVVSFGLPLRVGNGIFNVAALAVDGQLRGFTGKQHLAGDGIHYEPRWFRAWPAGVQESVRVLGKEVPVGDLFYEIGGVRLGFEICEDAWVAGRPGAQLARKGIDLLLNPSASHLLSARMRFASGSCWRVRAPSPAVMCTPTCWAMRRDERCTTGRR